MAILRGWGKGARLSHRARAGPVRGIGPCEVAGWSWRPRLSHRGFPWSNPPSAGLLQRKLILSTHPRGLHSQNLAELRDLARQVAHADGAVVRGAVLVPRLDEAAGAEWKAIAAVRVADL